MRRVGIGVGVLILVAACAGLGWWVQESAAQHREAVRRLDALEALPEHSFVVLARTLEEGRGFCLTYATAFGPQKECRNLTFLPTMDCWEVARLGEIIPDCWRPTIIEEDAPEEDG